MAKAGKRFRRLKRALRRPFEWLGIGLGYLVFTNLTHKGMLRVCDFVSAVMYRFDRKGRDNAHFNLGVMFGSLDPKREELIVRGSYRNMARAVGHAFWTCRNAVARARKAGEMSPRGAAFLSANKPAVTVSGHIGCWEILSQLAYLEGHQMMSVAKDIGTGAMTKLLMKARMSIGQEIVPAAGAFRPLMAGIKAGKSLGLLVDQKVKPADGGVWVRFFGQPVSVSAAPAFFALKAKAPTIVAWSRPLKDGRYRCEVINTYTADDAKDVWGMTQRCLTDLEGGIRRHPGCWVLNYHACRRTPKPEGVAKLAENEAKAAERAAKGVAE